MSSVAEALRYAAPHGFDSMAAKFGTVKLYVLLTEALCRGDWYETAEAALAGGARAIQLREKQLPDVELLDRARRIRELCEQYEALLIINARAVAAWGLRSKTDLPRGRLPKTPSAHNSIIRPQ